MAWKYFTIGQAELAAGRLKDTHLRLCIGQTKAVLGRLSGNMDEATSSLQDFVSNDPAAAVNKRVRCEVGVAIIQRALNCIQVADLSTAQSLLEDWNPLGDDPSPLEKVLGFRKHSLLGRVMRLQGNFGNALRLLKMAYQASQEPSELVFDEDLRDMTCDLADTLRELDETVTGEAYLRTEIIRRTERPDPLRGKSLLELALAEALFAQERYGEAAEICADIETRTSLLKYERLRVYVILAKLSHIRSDFEVALSRWSEAMQALQDFSLVDGQVQTIISTSIADVLDAQGHNWLTRESPRKASLTELAKPQGVPHWIAGFRQWAEYLHSRGSHCDT
jgi:tetratricopeptide (TPR) repeat protein